MSGSMGRPGGTRPVLKGNLALKSSPLNPSSGKMVAQDLVVDHMNAHYKKLLNAKSAIDATVPRAYQNSQKVRDRQTRNYIMSNKNMSGNRPSSARPGSARPSSARAGGARNGRPSSAHGARRSYNLNTMEAFRLDDNDYGDFTQDEINCINAMVNDTIDSERLDRVLNGEPGTNGPLGPKDTSRTSRSGGSGSGGQRTSRGHTEALNMNTRQRKTMSADILEKRNHVFSEPQGAFTPRVLKNPKYQNVPSKLSQTKHFRPAKRGSPPPVSRGNKSYAQSNSESEMLDETLMSRDFSTRMTMSGAVPKLDISIDQDHMKWLQEQSARHENKDYSPLEQELNQRQQRPSGGHQRQPGGQQTAQAITNKKTHTRKKIQKEDEELAYLDFITDVTNDVLTRGIFTNRVLCNVFEEHVQKNKDKLDEDRLRGMLDNLRDDLGIADTGSYRENGDDVGMGSSRPAVRSKTKTTGYNGDPSQFKNVRVGQLSREVRQNESWSKSGVDDTSAGGDYHKVNGMMSTQTMNAADPASLTDIAEVSEKTASVSSIRSKSSGKHQTPHSAGSNKQQKKMDDALIDLLGFDVGEDSMDAPALNGSNKGIENMSVKSALSTHTSDKASSHKASTGKADPLDAFAKRTDPIDDYANRLIEKEQSDKASVRSAASRKSGKSTTSKTSTLKDEPHTPVSKPRPLDRQMSRESVTSSGGAPRPAPRRSSIDSAASKPSVTPRRQISTESASKYGGESARSRQQDDEEERDDLESNVDFGKTTLFGKTRYLGLTYKALSQASDEDYDYKDDKFSDDDDF